MTEDEKKELGVEHPTKPEKPQPQPLDAPPQGPPPPPHPHADEPIGP